MKFYNGLSVLEELADARGVYPKSVYTYGRKLLEPKNKVWFDDKVEAMLLEFCDRWDLKVDIPKVLSELREIGFGRAYYKYEPLMEAVERLKKPNHKYNAKAKYVRRAFNDILKEFKKESFSILEYKSVDDLIENLPKDTAHPGWSGMIMGIYSKREVIEKQGFETWLKELNTALRTGSFNKPILMGYRTQAGSPFDDDDVVTTAWKRKVRFINMVDVWQVMAELMFAKAVQKYMAGKNWYAGGKDTDELHREIRWQCRNRNYSVTTDYSAYDQTISDWLIHMAFDVIEAGFKNMSPDMAKLFRIIRMDFIHKVILDGDLQLHEVNKGVPSGSMFTQIVGSIINRIMIDSYVLSLGIKRKDYDCIVMGDDNIIFTFVKLDEKHMAHYLRDTFGVEVNPDKMDAAVLYEGEDPEFLSRTWKKAGVWRNPYELLARICYPERKRNYKNKAMRPEYIINSYILTFPLGMKELIDTEKFKLEYPCKNLTNMSKDELAVIAPQLPGSVAYQLLYSLQAA